MIVALLLGFAAGAQPVYVVVGAETVGVILFIGLLLYARYNLYVPPEKLEHEQVTYKELLQLLYSGVYNRGHVCAKSAHPFRLRCSRTRRHIGYCGAEGRL